MNPVNIKTETCPDCRGRGYVVRQVTVSYYGGGFSQLPKTVSCPRCKELGKVNVIYHRR